MKHLTNIVLILLLISCKGKQVDTNKKIDSASNKIETVETRKIVEYDSLLILNVDKSILFGHKNFKEKDIEFKQVVDGFPSDLIIKAGSPNGLDLIIIYKNKDYAKNLTNLIDYNNFDNFGFLKDGYICQVGLHDFDSDGIDELIIAIGNFINNNTFYVIKYKPNTVTSLSDFNDWVIIQKIISKNRIRINKDMIYKLDKDNSIIDSVQMTKIKN